MEQLEDRMNPPRQSIIANSAGGGGGPGGDGTLDGDGCQTRVKLIGRERHVEALLAIAIL